MAVTKKNEEAVSPVIGVILMVAITVILAALVINTALSLTTSNLQKTKVVATSVSRINTDIWVTYQGGTNDPELSYISINAPNGKIYNTTGTSGVLTTIGTTGKPHVGDTMILSGNATADKNQVVVVGHFTDGSDLVLLNAFI